MGTHNQYLEAPGPDADTGPVRISVCATCIDCGSPGEAGIGAGAALYGMLRDMLADHPFRDGIEVGRIRCLMACTEGCALTIASSGKMKYLLGRLSAERELAGQILDFAVMYRAAAMGITPNHEWPPLLAPHFIGRIPPAEPNDPAWDDDGADL